MQSARHIWRGQQNTKVILFIGVKSSGIVALGLPKLVPMAFYAFWIKGFFQILLGSLIRGLIREQLSDQRFAENDTEN